MISKQTIEAKIVPVLNEKLGCQKTPDHVKNRVKTLRGRYQSILEMIFGVFKSRFTIFKSAPPFPIKTQVELVLACAGLHNFLCKECRSDEFPIESEDGEFEDEKNDDEPGNQTQEQQ
ncbi:transposon PIF-defective Malus [Pyrus ussuriensis x Pyrus communis]|uniref:Transposon PIF-defective Malus n=1 Tax=Pyrus ussuriensis x Pyrus communis TaxID=2448454 RepID=A0A5N5I0Y0_9ROSA|nr:transposon PIF-defective Malus [Pyrus ussuriensis x Pyrus communis]